MKLDPALKVYVIVAKEAILPNGNKIRLLCGRAGAQGFHAMQMLGAPVDTVYTMAFLQARDTKELVHIRELLKKANITHKYYNESDLKLFGSNDECMTAIAVGPVASKDIIGILDHLPGWDC